MNILKELEGKKVTIWMQGEMGFGWSKKGKITEVKFGPYAQYNEAAFISFIPYRGRKVRKITLLSYKRFIVWEGYHEVDTEIYGAEKVTASGCTVRRSRATSFSSTWMEQAASSVNAEPFYTQGKA